MSYKVDPLKMNRAERILRSSWMGDFDTIPFGKVIEYMQSFADQAIEYACNDLLTPEEYDASGIRLMANRIKKDWNKLT